MGPRSCRAQDRGVREPLSAETRVRHLPLVLGVAAGTVALDQATKWWAVRTLDDHTIDLVWTLRLHLVTNTGAAFSLGQALGPLIAVGVLMVVGVLLWTGRTVGTRLGAVGLGLVLGGAIGNLLDRVFRPSDSLLGGAVVDFIDFQWWPVFNVADMGVFVGAMLLVLANWREGEPVADE